MSGPVLVASDLTKRFDGREGEVTPLRRAALALDAGCVTALVGDPGSGRTTLLRCLAGTYRPDAGSVLLSGPAGTVDLATAPSRTVAWARSWGLSIFDGPLAAPPRQSVARAVARAASCEPVVARAALARLGTSGLAPLPIGRLRRAEATAVALAAALANRAPVVLLDDVTGVADDDAVVAWLEERAAGGAAVLVSARPGDAVERVAHQVLAIERGVLRCLTP